MQCIVGYCFKYTRATSDWFCAPASRLVIRLVFQDLTMHINVGPEQHTQSLKQLLHNINSNNEAVSELARWGLSISQEVLVVRIETHASMLHRF